MSKAKVDFKPLPKRFYKRTAFDAVHEGYVITLDGKPIKTPQQKMLHTKSELLAQQIAVEWDAQIAVINTDTMPLTRLLNIALDRVQHDRDTLLADIANYCETDLLFYRAPLADTALPIDTGIEELRALQLQHFDPVLDWIKMQYGVVFVLTASLMPVPQPAVSLHKMAGLFAAASDHDLAALAMLVPILGSAVLTLTVWQGAITIEQALIAARLDETVQAEKWGEDADGAVKWVAKCRDAKAAAFFLTCN